jgi:uncharacterized protein (TIGR03437 family)
MLCGLGETTRPLGLNIYDPTLDIWTRGADIPIAGGADHCNVAAVNGKLYLLGAIRVGTSFTEGGTWEYDPMVNRWQKVGDMPTPRGAAGVAVVGTRIYVAGGLNGSGAVHNNFEVFDTVSRTWASLPRLAQPRDHLTAQAIGSRVFVISGRSGSQMIPQTEEYDTDTGVWRLRAAIPVPRGGIGSGIINGKIIVFGGEGNSGRPEQTFEEVHAYDPPNDIWTELALMPTPRHGLYGITLNDRIFAPGGGPIAGATFSTAHEVFYLPPDFLPRVPAESAVNAASLGQAVAPGSLISIFGERLSNGNQVGTTIPLAGRLNTVEVRMGNLRLPLFFVSPAQINTQLPFDLPIGPVTLTVSNVDRSGASFRTAPLVDFAPGIFSFGGDGTGQGTILIAGTGQVARPAVDPISRPAKRGEVVEIYCTGLGKVNNPPLLGQPSPANPPATTLVMPIVTIGGVRSEVLFSGLSPGFVGIYQVNVRVAPNTPPGLFIPVSLQMGPDGPESNTVTIAVE